MTNDALGMLVLPAVLFVMGLFFLISGMITPGSVSRKGPRRFARDRLVRLGVPLAVWALVSWPGAKWLIFEVGGEPTSFWWRFMHSDPFLDTGPMWFVEVLLIYSLAYAAWRQWTARTAAEPAPDRRSPLTGRTLIAIAAGISVGTVLVRLAFPLLSGQVGQSHLWQWPQFVAMFGLGIVGARRGWLSPVPDRICRGCGRAGGGPDRPHAGAALGRDPGGGQGPDRCRAGRGDLVRARVGARHPDTRRSRPLSIRVKYAHGPRVGTEARGRLRAYK